MASGNVAPCSEHGGKEGLREFSDQIVDTDDHVVTPQHCGNQPFRRSPTLTATRSARCAMTFDKSTRCAHKNANTKATDNNPRQVTGLIDD